MVDDDFDEFSFLPAQAAETGVTGALPSARRLTLTLEDGRTLSALRFAPADDLDRAPQVTFLHGAGLNAHTWDTTILSLGAPALALDLPGHGDSSWRADAAYTAATLAPDVIAALRAWAPVPQLVVGHSLGGLVAAAVAARAPELVRDLVLLDITPGIDTAGNAQQIARFFAGPTDWADREELVDRALAFGLGGTREAATRGVFLNSRVRPDGRVEWKHHFAHLAAAAAADSTAPRPGGDALAAVLTAAGWTDLRAVSAPVTLVRGDHGYVTEDDVRAFVAHVPTARVVTVATGHNVHEEQPADLGRMLRTHL